ncbi:hypothetical protein TNCT_55101 [Trichonephila clavata]|uniref:Uncharacterized protein n=1 Tax=Trichonephila clavata TaxID=2740835 RepID=A0A8X6IQC3_TRICU|nr:hypothetical protein TNCT_55101 [Trichonephila clavata]
MHIVYGRDLCNEIWISKRGDRLEAVRYSTKLKVRGLFVGKDKPFLCVPPMDWLVIMDLSKLNAFILRDLNQIC